ncbi:DUF1385 domain-containing protein [Alkaliphilus serpentinus]|uniref:DUF1385 domain-containing protein n=1 Tax=Alkaliphilus serpentinus TaxID=1482731 RepID=A0A833HPJ7_9FIRM|nr:DUF1385 domain-containing protein [Alkaliphilus serpentinus]KAB3530878.1 DUF1385 domain-containing protein [Alkaliphilus serpentinus]
MGKDQYTSIGGQALIEGVMMRGQDEIAIAVRTSETEITVKKEPVSGIVKKYNLQKIPLLRGALALIDSMVLGVRSLTYSAELLEASMGEANEPDKFEEFLKKIFKEKTNDVILYFSVFVAIIMSVGIFILGPTFIVSAIKRFIDSIVVLNLLEGTIRLTIFIVYIVLVSKLKEMQRVFQYHGAEHKAIYCYESGQELTVENSRKFTTLHPRCGTSFMFIVMMVSMLIFSLVGWNNLLIRVVSRLLLLPLIAGISYEIIKLAGKSSSPLMKIVSYPGLMMQKLTTIEPDDSQLEVAIEALKNVLVVNQGGIDK